MKKALSSGTNGPEVSETDRVNPSWRPGPKRDRCFLAYRSKGVLTAVLLQYMGNHTPVYNFARGRRGAAYLYVIQEPLKVPEITHLFEQVPALYIADGHHRCAAALRVAKELGARPGQTGEEPYNYVLSVIFPEICCTFCLNRVVKDLNGLSQEKFLGCSGKIPGGKGGTGRGPKTLHTFGLYLAGQWYGLKALDDTFPLTDPIASLDVSILQSNVLSPILGIENPGLMNALILWEAFRAFQPWKKLWTGRITPWLSPCIPLPCTS